MRLNVEALGDTTALKESIALVQSLLSGQKGMRSEADSHNALGQQPAYDLGPNRFKTETTPNRH